MKLSDIKKHALPALFKAGITPCLVGDRGVGKTESVRQFCQENGYELQEFRLGQAADGGDITGLGDVVKDANGEAVKTVFALPNFLASIHKKPNVVLHFDEFNRAPKDMIQYIFEMIYEKRLTINGFELGENSHVIISQNADVDGMNVTSFVDVAFYDRLCQIKADNDVASWVTYCNTRKDLDQSVVNFFKENPNYIENARIPFTIEVKPTFRSATRLASLKKFVKDKGVFNELAMGMIGEDAAAGYIGWLENNEVVTIQDVLGDYPRVQAKIREYMGEKNNRQDIVGNLMLNLLTEAEVRHNQNQQMTIQENHHLIGFLLDISPDMTNKLLHELLLYPNFIKPDPSLDSKITVGAFNDDYYLTSPLIFDHIRKIRNYYPNEDRNVLLKKLLKHVE